MTNFEPRFYNTLLWPRVGLNGRSGRSALTNRLVMFSPDTLNVFFIVILTFYERYYFIIICTRLRLRQGVSEGSGSPCLVGYHIKYQLLYLVCSRRVCRWCNFGVYRDGCPRNVSPCWAPWRVKDTTDETIKTNMANPKKAKRTLSDVSDD